MNEDTTSIQTVIQREPMVRVSVAWIRTCIIEFPASYYWDAWCFSDDPRLKSFQSPSVTTQRATAQRIHDSIVRAVRRHLE